MSAVASRIPHGQVTGAYQRGYLGDAQTAQLCHLASCQAQLHLQS